MDGPDGSAMIGPLFEQAYYYQYHIFIKIVIYAYLNVCRKATNLQNPLYHISQIPDL